MFTGKLSTSQKERIVAVVKSSKNYREAKRKLQKMKIKVSLGGISKIMTRVKETHSVKDSKISGRPRHTTRAQDNSIRRMAVHNRRHSLTHKSFQHNQPNTHFPPHCHSSSERLWASTESSPQKGRYHSSPESSSVGLFKAIYQTPKYFLAQSPPH